jgi:hypothetical protein
MVAALVGVFFVLVVLVDCFEAIVLPRRVTHRWRFARLYYRSAWQVWRRMCRALPAGRYREGAYGVFGPMSLLGLFVCWASLLIFGFGLVNWGCHALPAEFSANLWEALYHSGETFFTLGYGDVTPASAFGKLLAVVEAGTGFGFMAIVIGYMPVLYQAFSSREKSIGLLDARAGSPPTASELLRRVGNPTESTELERFLVEWEAWAGELLESHLSYPVLGFYRSQHNNQSWLAALAMILDGSAVLIVTSETCRRRAELTFAMARHACVDLCLIFWLPPVKSDNQRLTGAEMASLFEHMKSGDATGELAKRLVAMRLLYEPYLLALSSYFHLSVPRFFPARSTPDNWQTSAWTKRAPGITELSLGNPPADEHFGQEI